MAKKSNYKNILGELDKLTKSKTLQAYIPTLDKDLPFLPITVKQQKSIITSTLDAIITNTVFNNTVNDIIKTNAPDNTSDDFFIIDRLPVLIALRVQALGYNVSVDDPDAEGVKYKVNIQDHVNGFNNFKLNRKSLASEVECDGIVADLHVPSLATDTRINKGARQIIENTPTNRFLNSIGQLFVFELVKYINTIRFNDNVIEFSSLTSQQAVDVVESLPMALSKKIVGFIQTLKAYENQFLQVKHNNKTLDLPIDATFFNSE